MKEHAKTKVLEETLPIRWVCATCLEVGRFSLRGVYVVDSGAGWRKFTVMLPRCCGHDMLLAGEPKVDIHGLRQKDSIIDPVLNLLMLPKEPVNE